MISLFTSFIGAILTLTGIFIDNPVLTIGGGVMMIGGWTYSVWETYKNRGGK